MKSCPLHNRQWIQCIMCRGEKGLLGWLVNYFGACFSAGSVCYPLHYWFCMFLFSACFGCMYVFVLHLPLVLDQRCLPNHVRHTIAALMDGMLVHQHIDVPDDHTTITNIVQCKNTRSVGSENTQQMVAMVAPMTSTRAHAKTNTKVHTLANAHSSKQTHAHIYNTATQSSSSK